MCLAVSDLCTFLDRNPELTPGQFEAFAALRTRVFEATADEAVGMTVSNLENRFDVKVQQVIFLVLLVRFAHNLSRASESNDKVVRLE